jgi:hypothetical protein
LLLGLVFDASPDTFFTAGDFQRASRMDCEAGRTAPESPGRRCPMIAGARGEVRWDLMPKLELRNQNYAALNS